MITEGPFKGLWSHGYGCILADPPWRTETWGKVDGRAPPYPTMTEQELFDLDVNRLAAPDCHLFMWTTAQHLDMSLRLGKRWGFRYSSIFQTWLKISAKGFPVLSMGKTTRKSTELLLLFRHGSPTRHATDIGELMAWDGEPMEQVVPAPRGEHSVKPEEVRRRIERYVDPEYRKIELFAQRSDRPGWTGWGLWNTKYNGAPVLE